MTFDFQSYLASIRTTYAKWWEYYTLTDATGKQRQAREDSPFFDFGLMVQTVKREERDRPTEEKVERFSVLDGLRKYADQQVLLVGRPGSGKSTALARLMLEEATDQQARIPVLVELRYWQGSIEQLIRDSLIRHDMPAEQVEAALKNALILFDGVNELPSEEARSQLSAFRRNHPKLPMIFTTRDLSIGGDLGIEKKLEMQPLSEDQMREFVRAYVPEQAEQMLQQLKDRLRELGQTPLLLWMLCSLFRRTGKIPENLGLVFREFTQGYERYLKEDVRIESDKAWWKPVLQQLAWVMMQGEKPTEFRVAIGFEEAVGAIGQFLDGKVAYAEDFARKCLRDLQKHHLIQAGTNREELEFQHQLIQEYYAAEALLGWLPNLTEKELKQTYLNYLKWTEPSTLMLVMIEDELLAVKIVSWAAEVDLALGARFIAELKQSTFIASSTLSLGAFKLQIEFNRKVDVEKAPFHKLSSFNNDQQAKRSHITKYNSLDNYINTLRGGNSSYGERKLAINVLANFDGNSDVVNLLCQILEAPEFDRSLKALALRSLAILGFLVSYEFIQKLLIDNDEATSKATIIEAIGIIKCEQAVPQLLDYILEEQESEIVMSAVVSSLLKIGEEKSLLCLKDYLIELDSKFETMDDFDKFQAYNRFLGYVLLDLEEEPELIHARLIPYLPRMCSEANLLEAFRDVSDSNSCHTHQWISAVESLAKIGYGPAINVLLLALNADDVSFIEAFRAVGRICLKQSLPVLFDHRNSIFEKLEFSDVQGTWGEFIDFHNVIKKIQANYKFYNYEIYQDHLKAQKNDRRTPQNSDRSHTTINNFPNVTEVKQTIMSNSSKYNFPNAQKVQIFEQVDTYIENNHSTDPEIKKAIADLTLLLTQLQTQHPQVKTESQALTILDAEFTEIQHSTTHPLVTLRQQLLNPERHLQAIKATLAEIAKHYLEESVWSKAAITYLDKMSETPDQGA